ncbi:ESAT-6 protein secretion system EspG family protein [Herbihabitans rhizosphaerae]|uniref:ESAT-6 protein secretion system EspG family protein n=1 Tax=Herbihabitans rhizosphaerae TaxID=1872711 RepID=A0A4Q7L4D0_9PSEU|nr:ESX secretion-associated protein EspG [Herbihabitans rhizosphaerae]RZS44478.1 ESAT-6 protein secretion system EspG family protein [Herbihabitans rhizosphaerae]
MVLPARAEINADLLNAIVEAEGLGELHLVLRDGPDQAVWYPHSYRETLASRVREECTRLGWYDRRGQLEIEIEAALRVLCAGSVEYFGWVRHPLDEGGEAVTGVVVAAIAREAVLAIRRGNTVWLSQISNANKLPERLVAQLPPVRPGSGQPLRAPQRDIAAVRSDGRTRNQGGVALRRAAPDARHIRQIMALPSFGGGELYGGVRDGHGIYRRSDRPIRYTDTDRGRYRATITDTPDDTYVEVAPGSDADLINQLRAVQRSLTR